MRRSTRAAAGSAWPWIASVALPSLLRSRAFACVTPFAAATLLPPSEPGSFAPAVVARLLAVDAVARALPLAARRPAVAARLVASGAGATGRA